MFPSSLSVSRARIPERCMLRRVRERGVGCGSRRWKDVFRWVIAGIDLKMVLVQDSGVWLRPGLAGTAAK
jgi:hypothetical protein